MQNQSTQGGIISIEEYLSRMNKVLEEYKKQQELTLEKLDKLELVLREQTEKLRNLNLQNNK